MVQPAVLTFHFIHPVAATGTPLATLDLSMIASIVNRRFYRQGLNWAVAGIRMQADRDSECRIQVLPNSWVLANAHTKTYHIWQKFQAQAPEATKPTFRDFKVYMDAAHEMGSTEELVPLGYEPGIGHSASLYEWNYVDIAVPNDGLDAAGHPVTGMYNIHMIGDDTATSKGAVHGYAMSRSRPDSESPNHPVGEAWYNQLFDDGDQLDNVEGIIESEGEKAPYPIGENDGDAEFYPGGQQQATSVAAFEVDKLVMQTTNLSGKDSSVGFNAPCGLIRFDFDPGDFTTTFEIFVDLVPGDQRGYTTQPMKEMN